MTVLPQRRLGADGPLVGAVGLGTMALSGIYGEVDDDDSVRLVHRAIDEGVTLFDTSDSYGQGHNEQLLGRALTGRRDQVVLASKFGIQREGLGRPDRVRAALEASLRRLGTDHLDVYYMHRFDPTTPIEDSMGALGELVAEGKIRHVGLSEISAARLRDAHAVHPVAVVQQEYSLFTREPEVDLLPTMRELGVGLVAYSPLGRGFLGGTFRSVADIAADDPRRSRYPRYSEQNLERNLALARAIFDIAEARHIPPAVLALAWVLSRGDDVVPIPGTRRVQNLMSNISAAAVELDGVTLADLERVAPRGAAVGERYDEAMSRRIERGEET
jgi:aryl-alcohol dehydrogenase-like predicted oxidoreductase